MSLLTELFLVLMTRAINISLLTEFGSIQNLVSLPHVLKLTPMRGAGWRPTRSDQITNSAFWNPARKRNPEAGEIPSRLRRDQFLDSSGIWLLGFGAYLELGYCCLEFSSRCPSCIT